MNRSFSPRASLRHFVHYDLIPILSMAAVCAFPCVFMYARNASEVAPSAMAPFLIVFSLNAAAFFLLALIFLRNASRAAFWTDLAMLVVINFCLLAVNIKRILPFLRDRYLLALLLGLLVLVFIRLLRKKPDLRTVCLLITIAFGSMIAINLIAAVPAIVSGQSAQNELAGAPPKGRRDAPPKGGEKAPPEPSWEDLSSISFPSADRPNVYYFLFDEYGGYDNLLHYYDYDNSPFLKELEEAGFSMSLHSHNTEAIHTDTIVPNLLNLQYIVKASDSGHQKAVFRNNPQLYQMFQHNGYQVNLINHTDYLGEAGCRVLTRHQTRRTISDFLMRNSLYNKFPQMHALMENYFVLDYGAHYREGLDSAMEAGLSCWQAAEENGAPTLTIGYYQFPHSPTMVGPNGEELPYADGWNWRKKELYLGQVEYCNKFILQLIAGIQENDPDALIFLQSDHGNRYALHMTDLGEWESYDPHVENPYMQNVLNAVYYRGERFDIEGKNGINTLRDCIDQVFGTNLDEIEPVVDFTDAAGDEKQ